MAEIDNVLNAPLTEQEQAEAEQYLREFEESMRALREKDVRASMPPIVKPTTE